MRYKEYAPPRAWSLWVLIIYALLLLPLCWLPQLGTEEASVALIAGEMEELGDFFTFRLFGQQEFVLPLLPWVMALLGTFMPINEFSIRLISIIPVGLLAFLCYWVVRRCTGLKTGAVAAAVVVSNFIVLQKGVIGDGYMLYALFINLAWFLFYYFGRMKRQWLLAWFLSHLFLSAAIMTMGLKAVFLFYFPLLWMRRPFNIRRRLITPEHALSFCLCLGLLAGLITMIPDLKENLSGFLTTFGVTNQRDNYFFRLLAFPVTAIAGTFPWIFLAWPAFCQAFRPLEKPQVFANYNRTIVSSIFFLFWLIPFRKPSELLPLIGPFAVLVAVNYDVLVRRYGPELKRLVQGMSIVTLILATAWVAGGYFQSREGLTLLAQLQPSAGEAATFMVCCSVVLAGLFILSMPRYPIWFLFLCAMLMLKMLYTGTYQANQFKKDNRRRALAQRLSVPSLPDDEILYEVVPGSEKRNFTSEWYYLDNEVRKLGPDGKLPSTKEVYVIAGKNEPTVDSETLLPTEESVPREWTPLTPEISYQYKDERVPLTIWKGVKNEQVFTWRASDLKPDQGMIVYYKWLPEWRSLRGGSLTQKDSFRQPRWLRKYQAVYFEGGQFLQRTASGLIKHLEVEHTFVLAVKLWNRNEKQVLLDIRETGKEKGTVLQRLTYDPQTKMVSSFSRDREGKEVLLQQEADLSKASIIIVRRNKDKLELFVNPRPKPSAESAAGTTDQPASLLNSKPNILNEIQEGQMALYLGANVPDEGEPDQYMYGLLPEFRIVNRWLDDQRMYTLTELLLKKYF